MTECNEQPVLNWLQFAQVAEYFTRRVLTDSDRRGTQII